MALFPLLHLNIIESPLTAALVHVEGEMAGLAGGRSGRRTGVGRVKWFQERIHCPRLSRSPYPVNSFLFTPHMFSKTVALHRQPSRVVKCNQIYADLILFGVNDTCYNLFSLASGSYFGLLYSVNEIENEKELILG